MTPDVSVIIPTYRRPEKLARALASLSSARGSRYEVIVIDDCSDGSAYKVAMEFKAQYFCKSGQQRGPSRSRNIGIDLASGKYLLFLDDDDFLTADGFDSLYQTISEGYTFVYGNFFHLYAQERVIRDLSPLTYDLLLICNRIPVGAYMMERSSIRRKFDERMRSHEDWDFLLSNIDWARCKHVPAGVVVIDKTENHVTSMQASQPDCYLQGPGSRSARRRQYFWLDFISVYSRFPAPNLSIHRRDMLMTLGISLDEKMLHHEETI